ncbi:unnamed protein product [Mesocestoides corti]|nr:unnamed protein product [Mesocestoides corti]
MQDIMDTGITLVENISKTRKVLPMEAIYILHPNKESVSRLLKDFTSNPKHYTSAYVYFTVACSDELLRQISTSGCLKSFKALSVLNIGFLPVESHIFSVNCHDTAWLYTCPLDRVSNMSMRLESLAEQIASVCVLLNEFPKVRYRKRTCNLELAKLIQMKLAKHKEDSPQFGQGTHKDRSILLLLDRGFDPLTPLLHDLTLQPLVRDLKETEDDYYRYGNDQEFELTDKDKLWKELRNEHIADVSRTLPTRLRMFAESKQHFLASKKKADDIARATGGGVSTCDDSSVCSSPGFVNYGADVPSGSSSISSASGNASSLRALQTMVREMPQYQKEAASYNALVSMTDFCLSACRENVNAICAIEQDLSMGQTAQGDVLANPMMSLVNILKPDSMSEVVRFRLLLIYIISQGGISETNLEKLLDYARLSLTYKTLVAAMSSVIGARLIISAGGSFDSPLYRGLPDLASAPPFIQHFLPIKGKRLRDVDENSYALSRWVPYLDDILEKCISDTLDSQCFPYLLNSHASRPQTGALLQIPDQSAFSGAGDVRGPSARFRAHSPQPGSVGGPGGASSPADVSIQQRPGSGRIRTVNVPEDIYGRSRMSEHCGPRLIVFIVGGATWPETRVCYSVTQRCVETRLAASDKSSSSITTSKGRSSFGRHSRKSDAPSPAPNLHLLRNGGGTGWNWEVILGGTGVITPKQFISNLQNLAEYC